ncbi:MAG: hypothetical protein K2R93_19365 [Gemmatimonadaceae bacterium]|nr:hypothetical protein [Gemmatimonadaceae bacterium]
MAVALLSSSACGDSPTDPLSDAPTTVRTFLAADSTLMVRRVVRVPLSAGQQAALYRVYYGEPLDCLSGCFYAEALTLQLGTRIGWVQGGDRLPNASVFVFEASDSDVFTPAVLAELKQRDFYAHRTVTQALARVALASSE